MAEFVDDLDLNGKGERGTDFVDDLNLFEKPEPSLWDRTKSAFRSITVTPDNISQSEPHGPMTAAVKLIHGVRDGEREPLLLTKESTRKALGRTLGDPAISLAKGIIGAGESVVGVLDIPTHGAVGYGMDAIGYDPKIAKETLEQLYTPGQQAANRNVQGAEGFVRTIEQALKNPSVIAHSVIESAPSMVGAGGLGRSLLKAGITKSPIIAGAIGEGAISGGSTAEQARQASKMRLLDSKQVAVSAGSGAATALIGVFGGNLAKKLNIFDAETLMTGGSVDAVVSDKMVAAKKNILKKIAQSVIMEGTVEELPQSAQEQISQNIAQGKKWSEGVENAAVMGWLTGGVMGGGGAVGGHILSRPELSKVKESVLKEKEAEPFVDDLNLFEEKENIPKAEENHEGDLKQKAGVSDELNVEQNKETDETIQAQEEKQEVEPKRLIDDILKDLDEVLGQQEEIEKAKDAGIAVSPEKETVIEQKADDLKTELTESVKEERKIESAEDVKPIVKEALQKPTPIPTKEAVATKAQTKQTLESGLKSGEIAADTPVRLTTVDELRSIIKNDKLFVGKDAEGYDVISAQKIKQDVPIVGYGANNKISAAIIFEPSHVEGKGVAPNEVSINPKTAVGRLRFVIDGHDKILTLDEIKEIYKGETAEQAVKTEKTLPASIEEAKSGESSQKEQIAEIKPATLPHELSKSNPRYSYREKQFQIEFPDDVTKAAYIVRNSKKLSAKDAGFMSFLRSQYPEKTDEQIRALGESIKSDLTTQAKTAKHNTTLKVNSIIQEKENVDPAGQSDKIETDEVDLYDRPDSKKILDEAGTEGHEAADIAASLREGEEIGDSEGAILSPREVEAKVEKLAEELGVEKPSKRQAKRQPKNQKTEKGDSRNVLHPELAESKIDKEIERQENEWIAEQLRKLEEETEPGGIEAISDKDIRDGVEEALAAEGYSSEQIEENAAELDDFFASVAKSSLEKPSEPAIIPDVTTPKGTGNIPPETTPKPVGGKYSYKDIYESLPDKEIVNAYNNTDYLRWQMHGTREEFLPQNARSITPDHETINKGYSAFNNIEEALDYHHFTPNDDDWVVLFNGKKIGSGVDGEPLVIPDMKSVAWFKWDDVVRSLSPREWIESLFPHWGNINKSDVIGFFEADESKFSTEEWKKLFKEEFGDDADEIDKILSKLTPNPSRPPEVGGQSVNLSTEEVKSKQTEIPGASYSETFSLTNPETEISKPLPEQVTPKNQDLFADQIPDATKKVEATKPKQPWEMTLDELASQKTNWYAGKQYLIPRDKFIELGIARNYEKRDDGYYGFNYDNNKEYRVDEKILNNMREESAKSHKYYVQKARKEGKEIPEAVLKDYPELNREELYEQNTDDSGVELAYNKRNRIRTGIKWTDIQDKNTALKVKEVTKANVYPKPDYQQMVADGMHPMSAYLVKTVYDSIPPTPVIGSRTITDEDMQRYITAVNRVMDGVTVWANDKEAIKAWASKQASVAGAMLGRVTSITDLAKADKSLLGMIYPDGYKNHMEEVRILGGRSIIQGLQPGYKQVEKAIKEIEKGWPGKIESWQRQGYAVIERKNIKVPEGWTDSKNNPVYMTEINGRTFGERYGSREDAQAAIDKMQPFILVDKYSRPVSEHETLEEAQEAARGKVKREGGKTINEKGISVESAERVGETRRKEGENITSDRLRETFGFKGVNFGNWMKGNANEAERQLHLNHAYDSFMDLAELLNVPPEALSLNGMLGVAIGAQGSGAAAAHFVPGVNEINLTRTAGAGAIAHEWAHALDHYFGTQAGLSAAKHPYLTENKPIGENIRPEIVSLFNKIVHTMNHKTLTITPEEQTRQDETRKQQAKGNVESWLKSIRGDYINNGIDEQAFDAIANRIRNMELGDGRVSVSGYFSMSPAVSELRNLYKEKTGRTYSLDQIKGLQTNIDHYKYLSEKDQTDHVPQTRETYTDYHKEAASLDKNKKKDYWSTNREKFARAFDAFITDSIEEKAAKNTYLSGIEAAPPKGEERKTINQAFRELVDEIKTRETENGLMLFDNEGNYDIIEAKKAGLVDDETIQRIENYGNEISTSKRGNLDPKVRASKIPANLTKRGFIDLRGQKIESPRDLAAICQIFRDPQIETLRYFYLKDGVIVGHEGISSRMPGFVSFSKNENPSKHIIKIIDRASRLKADEIYLLHNHPSGEPKPSKEDMQATATFAGLLDTKARELGKTPVMLSGHIIIDHKKYGVIIPTLSFNESGKVDGADIDHEILDLPGGKEYSAPSIPHELLGQKIRVPEDVARAGQAIKSPKNYATLVFRDGAGKICGIQDVHIGTLKGKDADGYLKNRAREFGAADIFAHASDIGLIGETTVRKLIENKSLRDVVWNNKSAYESGMTGRRGYAFGRKIEGYKSYRAHEEETPYHWSNKNVEVLTDKQKEARARIERNLKIIGTEAQKTGMPVEAYMKSIGMPEAQITRLMEYAKAQPVEPPAGYREALPGEVLPTGSDVKMDFVSGKTFVKEKETTGIKHAVVDEERKEAGKEPVRKQSPRGNEGMFQAAKEAIDSGKLDPRLLAQEVAKKPRPITTEEEFALMYDRMRIKNELRDIQRQIDTAQQDKNSQMEADLLERRTAIESDLDTNDQATTHGGSEVGRSLQARTRMINEDYSLEEILLRARQDNGGTLSEEMRKKYEALAREIEEANEKIKAYEEKIASLEAKRSFQRMKNDDVIIRHLGQAKEKRASAKKALDDEFSQLTKQLKAALGGIHMNFDPTAVKILALMAKNRIKAGILTPDGIVNEIYEQVHESYPEVEKRDIRDAISGYGRTLQLSKDEIDVQLREAKRLMRLISSYEDASSGQVPLRSGMQRDKMTNEVRELGRRVRQAMREAGIDWESSLSPEEQWKTSLDAVKTRLRNQIHDIKQQIETGEKSPKKIGIKYDEEAEALRAQRDKLKDILISIEGKPGMSPEQKINLAMAAVEKSIAEYERRISEKDLAPKKQGTGSPETPELKSLRDRRDELRAIYKEMQKEAKPKKTPEEIALQSYKTRMKNRIKELEEKLEKKDFAEKPKRELRLDDEGLTLKHNLDRAIYKYKEARLKDQLARRNWLQKFGGGIAETANFMRSVKASMDVSAVFRQGLFTVVSHPVVGAKALPAMFKAFKNDKYRFAVEQDILNRPNYKLYKDAGLDLTDIGTDLSKMEETFMSRLAEKIPGVAGSQRAYTTFLNKIRVDTFDLLIKNLVKSEGKYTPEEAKAIATLINESTGRGKVGMKPNTLSGLNTIFFAPRLVASRFQMLAGHSMWKGTWASRKLIAKEYGRFLAGMSVVYLLAQLAGFEIEWDPRSSEFGKIKIGNTWIDPLGGFSQVIVFLSRVISGKTKSSSGVIRPIRGDVQYGQGNTADVIWRFLRTKLAPAVSASIDALTGTDVVGNKVTVFNPDELKAPETVADIPQQIGKVSSIPEKAFAPMALVDIYEAMRDRGIPQGLAIGALGMLGVGIQTYEKDTKQKLKDDLRDAIKSEDQEAIDTAKEAISDASDNELITERDKKRILKDAKDDAFVSAAKKMPLPALAEMIKEDATDDQKEALHDIFKKKIDRARQERRIDSETQDRYYEILEEMR